MSCALRCRYYTETFLTWCLNNKMIVVLSLLSFSLFVSTLAIAGQRNRISRAFEEYKAANPPSVDVTTTPQVVETTTTQPVNSEEEGAGITTSASDETEGDGPTTPASDETEEEGPTSPTSDETKEDGPTNPASDETKEDGPTIPETDETEGEDGPTNPISGVNRKQNSKEDGIVQSEGEETSLPLENNGRLSIKSTLLKFMRYSN